MRAMGWVSRQRAGAAIQSPAMFGATPAVLMLATESSGVALDFTSEPSMQIKDTVTPANAFTGDPNSKLTYASPSTKWVLNKSGVLVSGTTLRTEYDANGKALGLRVESSATNLVPYSNASSGFSLSNAPNTAANQILPDGTTGGRFLSDTEVTSPHFVYPSALGGGLTSATDYAITAVVKASSRFLILNLQGSANNWASAVFDIANTSATAASQTAVGASSGTIQRTRQSHLIGGWVICTLVARCSTSATPCIGLAPAASGNTFTTLGLISYLGNLTGFYIEHFQVEAGLDASSRIVTSGSMVTRGADNISLATSAFALSATAGSLLAMGAAVDGSSAATSRYLCGLTDGTTNEFIALRSLNNNPEFVILDSGNNKTLDAGTWSSVAASKFAGAWAANDGAASYNGAAAVTNATVGTPAPTSLQIGRASPTADYYNGYIQKVVYLPRRMSNAELAGATA